MNNKLLRRCIAVLHTLIICVYSFACELETKDGVLLNLDDIDIHGEPVFLYFSVYGETATVLSDVEPNQLRTFKLIELVSNNADDLQSYCFYGSVNSTTRNANKEIFKFLFSPNLQVTSLVANLLREENNDFALSYLQNQLNGLAPSVIEQNLLLFEALGEELAQRFYGDSELSNLKKLSEIAKTADLHTTSLTSNLLALELLIFQFDNDLITNLKNSIRSNIISGTLQHRMHFLRLSVMFYLFNDKPYLAKTHLNELENLLKTGIEQVSLHKRATFFDLKAHHSLVMSKFELEKQDEFIQQALDFEIKALDLSIQSHNLKFSARVLNNLGHILRKQKRINEAISCFLLALHITKEKSQPNAVLYLHSNLAQLYLSLGETWSARAFFEEGLLETNENLVNNKQLLCRLLFLESDSGKKLDDLTNCFEKYFELIKHYNSPNSTNNFVLLLLDLRLSELISDKKYNDYLTQLIEDSPSTYFFSNEVNAKKFLVKGFSETNRSARQQLFEKSQMLSKSSKDVGLDTFISTQIAIFCIKNNNCSDDLIHKSISGALDNIKNMLSQINKEDLRLSFVNRIDEFLKIMVDYYANNDDISALINLISVVNTLDSLALAGSVDVPIYKNNVLGSDVSTAALSLASNTYSKIDYLKYRHFGHGNISQFNVRNELVALYTRLSNSPAKLRKEDRSYDIIEMQDTDENNNIFTFMDGIESSWLIVQHSEGKDLFEISRAKNLHKEVVELSSKILNTSPDVKTKVNLILSKLFPGASSQFLINRVYIRSSSRFQRFPFATILPVNNGITSISTLLSKRVYEDNFSFENNQLIAFTDPIIVRYANDWRSSLPKLPWSRKEVDFINENLNFTSLIEYSGRQATKQNFFSEETRHAKILHIATHSFFDPNIPNVVGFTLSPEIESNDNGFIVYEEIEQSNFTNQLVFVNGCDSARGLSSATSVRSMAIAFLNAGAKQTIGTKWPVSDRSSAVFTKYFYEELSKTKVPSVAIVNAQRKMSKHARFKDPYYWAAYTLYSNNTLVNYVEL